MAAFAKNRAKLVLLSKLGVDIVILREPRMNVDGLNRGVGDGKDSVQVLHIGYTQSGGQCMMYISLTVFESAMDWTCSTAGWQRGQAAMAFRIKYAFWKTDQLKSYEKGDGRLTQMA